MNLANLKSLFADNGCSKIYVKLLSPNDNSKNQVYFGGNFDILNILPISDIKAEPAGDWNRERFKAAIGFSWVDNEGNVAPAPHAQLILYPKYPEVRFSGFLKGCTRPPSQLMSQRLPNRVLFISVTNQGLILGHVAGPDSELALEFGRSNTDAVQGVFRVIELTDSLDNKSKLLSELWRINNLGWIKSKRLDRNGALLDCDAPNCGGYTLEAELGITPNGFAEPDYLGWEVKQFAVKKLDQFFSAVITLMTPEPTDGLYAEKGVADFIYKYGYKDKVGREDRMNFGGIHKFGIRHQHTKLQLHLIGYDLIANKIKKSDGRIALVDENDIEAASWSFSSLLLHWNRKHTQACYVPTLSDNVEQRKYHFGNKIILGTGTDFLLFLAQMAHGNIYYDPGIKMEHISSNRPQIKRRSQFRIKSKHLPDLYFDNEVIDLLNWKISIGPED